VESAGEALERERIEGLAEVLQREGGRLREELQKAESAGAHMQVYFGAGGKPGNSPPCEETFGHINAFLCAFQTAWDEVAQTLGQHIASAESWQAVAATTPRADGRTDADQSLVDQSADVVAETTGHATEEVPSTACTGGAVAGPPPPGAVHSAPTPLRRRQHRRSAPSVVPVSTSAVSTPRRASRPLRSDLLGPRCLSLDAAPEQVPRGSLISGFQSVGSPCKFHVIFDENDTEVEELTESEGSTSCVRSFSESPPCRTRAATADALHLAESK